MSNLKLNKNEEQEVSYIKEQEEVQGRKLFANKKANIAMIIAGAVIVAGIIAVAIYAYI